jgi:TonB family protein
MTLVCIALLCVLFLGGTAQQPLRVTKGMVLPVAIRRVEPDYSKVKRNKYSSGFVILEAVITEKGDVRDVRILKEPRNPYAIAVAEALKRWKFRPATLHGKPVAIVYNMTVSLHFR